MILIVLAGLILASILGGGIFLFVLVRRWKSIITSFVVPANVGEPSPLATIADTVAQMFGRSIAAQLKTTLMGVESGIVRAEKGLQADMAEDVLSQSPVGALLNSFPSVRKSLRRNPQMLDLVLQAASRLGTGNHSPASAERPRFQL